MVLLLNPEQIATFKREGFLLLPGALDPDACDRAREQMWGELCAAVPRLDPHDSTTWCHFTDSEIPSQRRSEAEFNNSYDGGDPRLDISKGDRFNLHNGCDELQINTFFHPLLAVAEQLLGTGEVLVPGGVGNNGLVSGPFFADGLSEATRAIHTAKEPRWPVPNKTETVALDPSAGCVSTLIGQGTRGIYGTLPAKDPGAHDSSAARRDWDGSAGTHNKEGAAPTGLHSDVGLSFPGRVMLRAVAFVGDCPPGSGGFTLWPRTHIPVWQKLWSRVHAQNRLPLADRQREWEDGVKEGVPYRQRVERWTGIGNTLVPERLDYHDADGKLIRDTKALELFGPAGTVALWHAGISHSVTTNFLSDVVRVMTVIDFHKTEAALPDEVLRERFARDGTSGVVDIWQDWAECVREEGSAVNSAVAARL